MSNRRWFWQVGLAVLAVFMAASVLPAALVAVRIQADSDEDVIRLVESGLMLEDVEISIYPASWGESVRVAWNRENGYATSVIDETELQPFLESYPVIKVSPFETSCGASSLNELDNPVLFGYSWGWPQQMLGFPGVSHQVPTVADLDGNGDYEIVLHTIEGYRYAWQHDGGLVPGYPMEPTAPDRPATWVSTASRETGAAIDLYQDEGDAVLFGTGPGYILGIHYVLDNPWNAIWRDLGTGFYSGVPAVHDVNLDGIEDLVINVYDVSDFTVTEGWLHIFGGDGFEVEGWPQDYPNPSTSSPVVGDIDGDDLVEIIIATAHSLDNTGGLYAWNADGSPVSGWPVLGFHTIGGTPTLADIDDEPGLEVIIRCKPLSEQDGENGIYAWHGDGQLVDGFPLQVPVGHPYGSVAVADMDGNALFDFAIGTVDVEGHAGIYVYEQGTGLREEFPRYPGGTWISGSPIFADVTGDGLAEVIAIQRYTGWTSRSRLVAYDADGLLVGEAYMLPEDDGFLTTSPTAFDLDQDGYIELIAASTNGYLYVWDTIGWPGVSMFPCDKGDFRRTGKYVPHPENPVEDYEQVTDPIPGDFAITSVYPSPFNSITEISFILPAAGWLEICVFDILGREVTTVVDRHYKAGARRVTWKADDSLPSGMYFIRGIFKGQQLVRKVVYMK